MTQLTTNNSGTTWFFLPLFGMLLWVICPMLYFAWKDEWRSIEWGNRRVLAPLLVIAGAIVISGLSSSTWGEGLAQAGLAMSLVVLYLASRKLGSAVLAPFAVGVAAASVGVIVSAVLHPGRVTGGLVFGENYNIVVGYTLLGALAWQGRYRHVLLGIVTVGLLLSGSPEGFFGLGVLAIAVIIRRDWNRKAVAASGAIFAGCLLAYIAMFPNGSSTYAYLSKVLVDQPTIANPTDDNTGERQAIAYRIDTIKTAMTNIKPLGDGFIIGTGFRFNDRPNEYWKVVHNTPLVIVQQLGWPGILAAIAWLWVAVWCVVKTKTKYLWALVLGLSVWDNYVWVQLAPLFWTLVGVTTTQNTVENDLIFRRGETSQAIVKAVYASPYRGKL